MKVYIASQGDRSVGISPCEMTIEFDGWKTAKDFFNDTSWDREELRGKICTFATEVFDDRCTARFVDECPDCGHSIVEPDKKCCNELCVDL